jgi:hypothetical protein
MLTPEDEQKIAQIGDMMRLSPEALREYQPNVKYVFLRSQHFIVERDGKLEIDRNSLLGTALLANTEPPEGFELIRTLWLEQEGQRVMYGKAFAVH